LGSCDSLVSAVQRRKIVPGFAADEKACGSLPTTTFQGRTSHFFSEAVGDIGILAGEGFDSTFVIHVKDEQGAVDGFGKRAGKNEFTPLASFVSQAQVLLAELSATGHIVINHFVKQSVVVHRGHLFDVLA